MPARRWPLPWLKSLALTYCSLLLLHQLLLWSGLDDRLYLAWLHWSIPAEQQARAIDLSDYRVEVEARPLPGVAHNASGLTWNRQRQTLFLALNGPNQLLELSPEGELLRRIELRGFEDVEGVDWVGGDRYVLADERRHSLILIELADDATQLDRGAARSFALDQGSGTNKGFEGVAWDPADNGLYVIKERDPMRLYKLHGLLGRPAPQSLSLQRDLPQARAALAFNDDLAGLHYDPASGSLLVLSDESRLLSEISPQGRTLSFLELSRHWHGLQRAVPQAEGVAMDERGTLYLVSEPNLLYVFRPRAEGP
ncbi:SdiA-regulated domain-containing protein [Pseudomonas benzenivorans]|uniref:SdiA-regulated domain-containing protein n=1 Tax=Pseudomonas benzenivorans TaxID=556533 RepID=A0ABY5H3T7_9PSED|nr:SdiA-regulated domain-containing protein [Pseudomonas benzenivorans]UTW06960.1 SdiA-regulated domain-containing protein [Pseudomonas benzenivorans]